MSGSDWIIRPFPGTSLYYPKDLGTWNRQLGNLLAAILTDSMDLALPVIVSTSDLMAKW